MVPARREGLSQLGNVADGSLQVLFTAHSIPVDMAAGSQYVQQLRELASLLAVRLNLRQGQWDLVYQSRSGPPHQPWLEPDVCDAIQQLSGTDVGSLLLVPIGFLSDHMEVIYDLDDEAAAAAREAGIPMVRAATVGTHPEFVTMIRELVEERQSGLSDRPALGMLGAAPDFCPPDCCRYTPAGRPQRSQ